MRPKAVNASDLFIGVLSGKPDPEHSPFLEQQADIMPGQSQSQRVWGDSKFLALNSVAGCALSTRTRPLRNSSTSIPLQINELTTDQLDPRVAARNSSPFVLT